MDLELKVYNSSRPSALGALRHRMLKNRKTLLFRGFRLFGTVPRTGPNAGEAPADLGALLVNRTEAGLRVQENAVSAPPLLKNEELRGRVEGPDRTLGVELPEHFLKRSGGLVFGDELETHQVDGADFHGKGAAPTPAPIAHAALILGPRRWPVD